MNAIVIGVAVDGALERLGGLGLVAGCRLAATTSPPANVRRTGVLRSATRDTRLTASIERAGLDDGDRGATRSGSSARYLRELAVEQARGGAATVALEAEQAVAGA